MKIIAESIIELELVCTCIIILFTLWCLSHLDHHIVSHPIESSHCY